MAGHYPLCFHLPVFILLYPAVLPVSGPFSFLPVLIIAEDRNRLNVDVIIKFKFTKQLPRPADQICIDLFGKIRLLTQRPGPVQDIVIRIHEINDPRIVSLIMRSPANRKSLLNKPR